MPLEVLSQNSASPTLRQTHEGNGALAVALFEQFELLNVWGKSPDSLETIARAFAEHLADYPLDKIMAAFKVHAGRNSTFPTPADILGLIRRKGKQPYDKAVYVNIAKKDYYDRTDEEHAYMRGYEADQMDGDISYNPQKEIGYVNQIASLRNQLAESQRENTKLAELLREARQAKGFEVPKKPIEKKVQDTADFMRKSGAKEEDIQEFLRSMGH
jgi:hypothetical protein